MISFDLYRPEATRSRGFFEGPIRAGSIVGLDSSGFRPNYFSERQSRELISFVVVPAAGIPPEPAAFERLTFVEGEVGEHNDETAKVLIRSVAAIGEWARVIWLTDKPGFAAVPEDLRPPADVINSLREALRAKESVAWVSTEPLDRERPGVAAVCLVKCDSDRRAIVLSDPRSPSYLARL